MAATDHTAIFLSLVAEYQSLNSTSGEIQLDGHSLTIATAAAISAKNFLRVVTSPEVPGLLRENAKFLIDLLSSGHAVYGVNTGYGGSANVRSPEAIELQRSFTRHLNVGFADKLDPEVMRVVMAVRANSLARGYSGVGPECVEMLCAMLTSDIVPLAPLRGYVEFLFCCEIFCRLKNYQVAKIARLCVGGKYT
jgi:histidine ammonia-lyase